MSRNGRKHLFAQARREKCTHENCTLPTIHLGLGLVKNNDDDDDEVSLRVYPNLDDHARSLSKW